MEKNDVRTTAMATGNDVEKNEARFKEADGVVSENLGDNGMIIVTARNQENEDMGERNLNGIDREKNYGENNVVIDRKRSRTERVVKIKDNGPTKMQTYELNGLEINVLKNEENAGSSVQARLEP